MKKLVFGFFKKSISSCVAVPIKHEENKKNLPPYFICDTFGRKSVMLRRFITSFYFFDHAQNLRFITYFYIFNVTFSLFRFFFQEPKKVLKCDMKIKFQQIYFKKKKILSELRQRFSSVSWNEFQFLFYAEIKNN